jgi:LacI family transcriptional regulator
LAESGLRPAATIERPFGGSAGYDALPELLNSVPRSTAVYVTSDLAAMGLLRAAFDRGLRVPEDLAVMSFDDIEYAAYTRPGLSTVRQPTAELGRLAVDLLSDVDVARGPKPGMHRLPTSLVLRGSCGCPDTFCPARDAHTAP